MNPQAVNQPNLDVFTRNKRSVLFLKHTPSGKEIAFVAIGALLVGSIAWTAEVSLFPRYLIAPVRSDMDLGTRERASRRRAWLFCVWWEHRRRRLPA